MHARSCIAIVVPSLALFNLTNAQIVHSLGSYNNTISKLKSTVRAAPGQIVFQFSSGPLEPGFSVTYDQVNEKSVMGGKFSGNPRSISVFPEGTAKQASISWDTVGTNAIRSVGYPAKGSGYLSVTFEIDGKQIIASTADYPDGGVRGTSATTAPPGSGTMEVTSTSEGRVSVTATAELFYRLAGEDKKKSFHVELTATDIIVDYEVLRKLKSSKPADSGFPAIIEFKTKAKSEYIQKRNESISTARQERAESTNFMVSVFEPMQSLGVNGNFATKVKQIANEYDKKWNSLYDSQLKAPVELEDSWKTKELVLGFLQYLSSLDEVSCSELEANEAGAWATVFDELIPELRSLTGGDALVQSIQTMAKDNRERAATLMSDAKKKREDAKLAWDALRSQKSS